jgi:hypothetical protein
MYSEDPVSESAETFGGAVAAKAGDTITGAVANLGMQLGVRAAFALPAPFGSVIGGGLSFIFGQAAGGDQDQLAAIQRMLDNVVVKIEQFLVDLRLKDSQANLKAFFDWVSANVTAAGDSVGPLSQDDVQQAIKKLNDAEGFQPGTLRNDLERIAGDDSYVRISDWLEPKDDHVLTYVMLNLSAQFMSYKLLSLLHANLAASVWHEGLRADNEKQYNDALISAKDALRKLRLLLWGRGQASAGGIGPGEYGQEMARITPKNGMWGYDGPASQLQTMRDNAIESLASLSAYAKEYGWLEALNRLFALRGINRLAGITLLNVNSDWGLVYSWVDYPAGWHYEDTDLNTVENAWHENLSNVMNALTRTYGPYQNMLMNWRYRVLDIERALPPGPPSANTVEIDDVAGWATDSPPSSSAWAKAVKVRYAFAYQNSHGPGPRTDWTEWIELRSPKARRWKPRLTKIPTTMDESVDQVLVWRQFASPASDGDRVVLGDPRVVAGFAPTTARPGRRSPNALGPRPRPISEFVDEDLG